ncbi:uncharacterized protein LOC133524543 [Cydia pomonella]|uniref:uncharacterized protein LOC133524543 n=1 Tax=Cydia pomonella TaxID=82600 RepID=UPI002ADDD460|nr:uncharacterized protein LOC133524543 [Cydia pomonella]
MNMNNTKGKNAKRGATKAPSTRDVGPSVRICQLNIEGISRSKSDCLSRIINNLDIDVVLLQETHAANELQLTRRGELAGYNLVAATYHAQYGTATYVHHSISQSTVVISNSIDHENIAVTSIEIAQTKICNIYKPPKSRWPEPALPELQHPSVYMGDFNSHHTSWGYKDIDENGKDIMEWADKTNAFLVHDNKTKGSFKSARWNRCYNPDLVFTSKDENSLPVPAKKSILDDFPNSHHRPILLEIGLKIPLVQSYPGPRWNFQKADWNQYAQKLDERIRWIEPQNSAFLEGIGKSTSRAGVGRLKSFGRSFRRRPIETQPTSL